MHKGMKNLRPHPENFKNEDAQVQRMRAYKRMTMEARQVRELEEQGWEMFYPTLVCDRIGIKDGKVYFIEFKKPGQELRRAQERIRNLVPDMYMVFTY